jgi:hypothetical protein
VNLLRRQLLQVDNGGCRTANFVTVRVGASLSGAIGAHHRFVRTRRERRCSRPYHRTRCRRQYRWGPSGSGGARWLHDPRYSAQLWSGDGLLPCSFEYLAVEPAGSSCRRLPRGSSVRPGDHARQHVRARKAASFKRNAAGLAAQRCGR